MQYGYKCTCSAGYTAQYYSINPELQGGDTRQTRRLLGGPFFPFAGPHYGNLIEKCADVDEC
jgi:hypothetical protein